MKIGTILFTYNRPEHTAKVIEGLKNNTELPEKLYIFHDGLKMEKHKSEWEEVRSIIEQVDFCPVEIIRSEKNKGLAKSIVDGVDYVLEYCDAVIVLEDDCVPMPLFMSYMNSALMKYLESNKVYGITGYTYDNINLKSVYDAYFIGRMCSWGWATWKNRWACFEEDEKILGRIYDDEIANRQLAIFGGTDLENMFEDKLSGKNDSWAVCWALKIIEKHGFILMPKKSLIKNIGFDGTGIHCDQMEVHTDLDRRKMGTWSLPEQIYIDECVEQSFIRTMGNPFANGKGQEEKEHIYVYGAGNYMRKHSADLYNNYYVEKIIDQSKQGYYGTVPIVTSTFLLKAKKRRILIVIENQDVCKNIKKDLIEKCGYNEKDICICSGTLWTEAC